MNNTWALIKDMFSKGVLFGGDLGGYTAPTNIIPSAVKDPTKAMRGGDANFYYNTKIPLKGKSKDRQRMFNNETKSILESKKKPTNGYNVKSSTGYNIQEPGVGFGEPFTKERSVSASKSVPSVLGASQPARSGIAPLDEATRKQYINNFMKYNKGDAKYTQEWVRTLLNSAPRYNLDPLTMLSIAALESGWGGTRYGNNLIGYGKTDSGDLGYNYENMDIAPAVNSLLKDVSNAWGGVYTNQTSPYGFVSNPKYKWNYNSDWPTKVSGTMNLIRGN